MLPAEKAGIQIGMTEVLRRYLLIEVYSSMNINTERFIKSYLDLRHQGEELFPHAEFITRRESELTRWTVGIKNDMSTSYGLILSTYYDPYQQFTIINNAIRG